MPVNKAVQSVISEDWNGLSKEHPVCQHLHSTEPFFRDAGRFGSFHGSHLFVFFDLLFQQLQSFFETFENVDGF